MSALPSFDNVVAEVVREHQVRRSDLLGPSRVGEVMRARRDLCVRLQAQGRNASEIGRLIGRDRDSVLNAIDRWRATEEGRDGVRPIGFRVEP